MQAFQRDLARFEKHSAQVLGVSSDSLANHHRFLLEYNLTLPLIADENRALARLYGSGRVTFIIGRDGLVHFVRKGVPDNREILEQLEKLGEKNH